MIKYHIAYGTDTETLEDPDQLVLLTCPKEWSELESEDLLGKISDHWGDSNVFEAQSLVGIQDIIDSLKLIIPAIPTFRNWQAGAVKAVSDQIIQSLIDAIDNN